MEKNKVVIIIPIYKKEMTKTEKASLLQCLKVLGNYDIKFICPNSLDTKNYEIELEKWEINANFIRFEDKHFNSLSSYSKFMLKKDLYKKISTYEFMLIYQLDAWVFEDKLEYWCEQNFDYIGAPWFEKYDLSTKDTPMMDVAGNGGFSLRKIDSILKVLESNYHLSFKEFLNKVKKNKKISSIINFPIFLIKYLLYLQSNFFERTTIFEDVVFVKYGPIFLKDFKVAEPKVALQFSFEVNPSLLYEMNNQQLPFGCHAFEKYEYETFWKNFINI